MRALIVVVVVAGCGGSQPAGREGRPLETECRSAAEHYATLAFREHGDVSGRPDRVLIENVEEECKSIWTREEYGCVRMAASLKDANACFTRSR
jgi:hypothetical protein